MNQVLPELIIGAKLGNGHFGEVFLGEDNVHGQVAVKVLAREPGESDAAWQSRKRGFLGEAQYLSKATHRNVVQVHHIKEAGDSIHFVMAYCAGGSLQTAYDQGPLTLCTIRKVATEVLMGLSALHARGMLHRDIKPGNILLDRTGTALIGDFGLVTDDLLLGYADRAGYNDHVAFEVWQGEGTSVKSDIWALGMTLYRLLHGHAWYVSELGRPRDVIRLGGYVNRLTWLPHVPKAWRRVIRKMLGDNPASRYQSANEALDAIALLPITPDWMVPELTTSKVRWERTAGKRLIIVEWERGSKRQQEWRAWSEPTGAGRKMSLGGSTGLLSGSEAVRELVAFFDKKQ